MLSRFQQSLENRRSAQLEPQPNRPSPRPVIYAYSYSYDRRFYRLLTLLPAAAAFFER